MKYRLDVKVRPYPGQDMVALLMTGTFSADTREEFEKAYEPLVGQYAYFIIDLSHVDGVDMGGLGAILKLRDRVGGKDRVLLFNIPEMLKKLIADMGSPDLFCTDRLTDLDSINLDQSDQSTLSYQSASES